MIVLNEVEPKVAFQAVHHMVDFVVLPSNCFNSTHMASPLDYNLLMKLSQ